MKKVSLTLVANLYPSEKKPYFGTFIKNIYETLDSRMFNKNKMVLPDFGEGIKGYFLFYLKAFIYLLKADGIVYVHYVSHSALPVLLSTIFNKNLKIILNYHGSDAFPESTENKFKSLIKKLICKWANNKSTLIVVPSEYFKKKIKTGYGVVDYKIYISPSGGYDKEIFYSTECEVKGESSQKLHYLYAGRMIEGKGCLLAAKAALKLSLENSKVTFTFLGSGPMQEEIKEILQPLIVEGRCNLMPSVNQSTLAEEFRKATFFLFPSMREGESLGLVLVEAIASGSIPIVIKQGAINEILGKTTEQLAAKKEEYVDLVLASGEMSKKEIELLKINLKERVIKYERKYVSNGLSSIMYKLSKSTDSLHGF